eukprot:1083660-Amphidinium_carterae.1
MNRRAREYHPGIREFEAQRSSFQTTTVVCDDNTQAFISCACVLVDCGVADIAGPVISKWSVVGSKVVQNEGSCVLLCAVQFPPQFFPVVATWSIVVAPLARPKCDAVHLFAVCCSVRPMEDS